MRERTTSHDNKVSINHSYRQEGLVLGLKGSLGWIGSAAGWFDRIVGFRDVLKERSILTFKRGKHETGLRLRDNVIVSSLTSRSTHSDGGLCGLYLRGRAGQLHLLLRLLFRHPRGFFELCELLSKLQTDGKQHRHVSWTHIKDLSLDSRI